MAPKNQKRYYREGGDLELVIALGTNLPFQQLSGVPLLEKAMSVLCQRPLTLIQVARFYRSAPQQMTMASNLDEFVNTAIHVSTQIKGSSPEGNLTEQLHNILHRLLEVELQFGRRRSGTAEKLARTLDLDLLFCQHHALSSSKLQLPHPHWMKRSFVLRPLLDLNYWHQHLAPYYGAQVKQLLTQGFAQDAFVIT